MIQGDKQTKLTPIANLHKMYVKTQYYLVIYHSVNLNYTWTHMVEILNRLALLIGDMHIFKMMR